MNRTRIAAFALAFAVLAAACGGTHPKPVYAYDHNVSFVGMTTYGWFSDPRYVMPHGDSVIDAAFLDSHIRSAVDDALRKKGYVKVDPSHAALLVAYSSGARGSASTTSTATTSGPPATSSRRTGRRNAP